MFTTFYALLQRDEKFDFRDSFLFLEEPGVFTFDHRSRVNGNAINSTRSRLAEVILSPAGSFTKCLHDLRRDLAELAGELELLRFIFDRRS